jgi:hypothetical protein
MRWGVVEKFDQLVLARLPTSPCVAVVGGSFSDPEVTAVVSAFPEASFSYFGDIVKTCG